MDIRFRRHHESITDSESWEQYSARLAITEEPAERYFFQHVVYWHYDDFTGRFHWFQLEDFSFTFENWTAERIHREIRYDAGENLDWHYHHFKIKKLIPLLTKMEEDHTWPMPPVVFVFSSSFTTKDKANITPVHLIEGTHRVSYLKKFLLDGFISPESKHKLLVLRNKDRTPSNQPM